MTCPLKVFPAHEICGKSDSVHISHPLIRSALPGSGEVTTSPLVEVDTSLSEPFVLNMRYRLSTLSDVEPWITPSEPVILHM